MLATMAQRKSRRKKTGAPDVSERSLGTYEIHVLSRQDRKRDAHTEWSRTHFAHKCECRWVLFSAALAIAPARGA